MFTVIGFHFLYFSFIPCYKMIKIYDMFAQNQFFILLF